MQILVLEKSIKEWNANVVSYIFPQNGSVSFIVFITIIYDLIDEFDISLGEDLACCRVPLLFSVSQWSMAGSRRMCWTLTTSYSPKMSSILEFEFQSVITDLPVKIHI